MNPYVGKICPYCKTELLPGDEIVLCSECDMPHHKECWAENKGCTTFGCQGTIKALGDAPASAAPRFGSGGTVYCTSCGTPSPDTAFFCTRCGSRLVTAPRTVRPPVHTRETQHPYGYHRQNGGETLAPELEQLVGEKAEYYLPKFQQMKRTGKGTSWNWAAFLVAPYWMIYRKMYAYGAGVLAAGFLLSLLGLANLLTLGGYIALGIFANSIYLKSLEEKAARARTMDMAMRSEFLAKNSGTDLTAAVLTAMGYGLLCVIIAI